LPAVGLELFLTVERMNSANRWEGEDMANIVVAGSMNRSRSKIRDSTFQRESANQNKVGEVFQNF